MIAYIHTSKAAHANKLRAQEIAKQIASQSDTSALVLLDKMKALYSASFLASVYKALESMQ